MSTDAKTYEPKAIEEKWYKHWMEKGYFHGDATTGGEPYCMVIPPPNVTGILHMGHALNNTIQDVLIRWNRMRGQNTVWIPGTDHASIATEGKVVQMLAEQGIAKNDLSREAFLEHAWNWREKYGGIIIDQLKKLGCSCDWERERFTMDEAYTKAVYTAFVRLYEKGLIYRGHRLVNWCPVSRSAISNEEVNHRDVQGKLWYFKYPIAEGDGFVVVATTRPETMLGDTGIAVNPKDERYRALIGKSVRLPLAGRDIPIFADEHVDPEFGTGCVKVTPAHDPNDFIMGERHNLAFINIMNDDASLNDSVPEVYRGMPREKAREQVVNDLDKLGLLDRVEDYAHSVGYSQRGDEPIEYYMSEQWFMSMKELAEPALRVVKEGDIQFHPPHWVKTYQHWMENIQDWCISRQLWWGQRIPVWYQRGADRNDPASRHVSVDGPPDPENWEQDEDVLDTWASSWLWPFAVHSWPADSKELKTYYPTQALTTGPDILFFWVARMVMAGMEFMDGVPFKDVYIHGIVRDDDGRKMSKSLGNILDPLEIIERYSADALRFSLIMLTATGQDVYVSDEKFELGRNFGTKIWNASRFIQMHDQGGPREVNLEAFDATGLSPDDHHILARLARTIKECDENLAKFRLNDYAKTLYDFFWHQFCDWYVEYGKSAFNGDDAERKEQVLSVMHHVLASGLRLLHPLMPFLTEELWHVLGYHQQAETIMLAPWPQGDKLTGIDAKAVEYVEAKHELIRAGRMLKSDYQISPSVKVDYAVRPVDGAAAERLKMDDASVSQLLRAGTWTIDPDYAPEQVMPSALTPLGTIYMSLEGALDVQAEIKRLTGQLDKLDGHIQGITKKLSNEGFIAKAPAKVIEGEKERRGELVEKRDKLAKMISSLTEMAAS